MTFKGDTEMTNKTLKQLFEEIAKGKKTSYSEDKRVEMFLQQTGFPQAWVAGDKTYLKSSQYDMESPPISTRFVVGRILEIYNKRIAATS